MEDINIWWLDEQLWNKQEVSEKDSQKVKEDSKKASKVRRQIKKSQQYNKQMADFLSKLLSKFYDNSEVLTNLSNYFDNLESNFDKVKIIFSPIIENEFKTVADYISYLKTNKKYFNKVDYDLLISVIKSEKIWNKWKLLKEENKYDKFIEFVSNEIKNLLL